VRRRDRSGGLPQNFMHLLRLKRANGRLPLDHRRRCSEDLLRLLPSVILLLLNKAGSQLLLNYIIIRPALVLVEVESGLRWHARNDIRPV